jgi:hypothetical protein
MGIGNTARFDGADLPLDLPALTGSGEPGQVGMRQRVVANHDLLDEFGRQELAVIVHLLADDEERRRHM